MKMLFKTRLCIAIAAAAAAAAVAAAAAAAVVGSGTYSGMLSHEAAEIAISFNLAGETVN
jgi:opacity protein-like surface antigen